MRRFSDSPFVLAASGTLAIHLIVLVCCDAMLVVHPQVAAPPEPHLELVDVELPPIVVAPPDRPIAKPEPIVPALPQPTATRSHAPHPVTAHPSAAHTVAALPAATTELPAGPGDGPPVVPLGDLPPTTEGHGSPTTPAPGPSAGGDRGSGSARQEIKVVSIATIKSPALPRGDYSYFSAGKDYPIEARRLGVEGVLKVRLTVDDHGKVIGRLLLNHLGHGLDELAMQRAAQIDFTPALDTDDRAVASIVVWTFTMALPK